MRVSLQKFFSSEAASRMQHTLLQQQETPAYSLRGMSQHIRSRGALQQAAAAHLHQLLRNTTSRSKKEKPTVSVTHHVSAAQQGQELQRAAVTGVENSMRVYVCVIKTMHRGALRPPPRTPTEPKMISNRPTSSSEVRPCLRQDLKSGDVAVCGKVFLRGLPLKAAGSEGT